MPLESRLRKLERRSPVGVDLPECTFITFVEPNHDERGMPSPGRSYPGLATIVGSDFGLIYPHEGEDQTTFQRRVFAIKAGGKMVEDMTDEEREAAYAEADAALARELGQ